MRRTVTTWAEVRQAWDGLHNFLMAGETVPFAFDMPPLKQVVEEVREDPDARICPGTRGEGLDLTDISEAFRKLPVDEAIRSSFQMSHFKLGKFYGPGRLFHGFEERVMEPWRRALAEAGFTWTRCYPILFISGPGCATNYHMDRSHVIAWQRHGTKRFCGLRDPRKWASLEERMKPGGTVRRPPGIRGADALVYEMGPGDVLWNALLTPHWVEATEETAYSLNLSHGGLRLNGRLCRHEQELEDWKQAHPDSK